MPTIRGISQAVSEIRAKDKESCITEHYIRSLCLQNKIKFNRAGNRYLINMQVLEDYLTNGDILPQVENAEGAIRRQNEKKS